MNLEFEKGELSGKLVCLGLSDKHASAVLSEFERHNYSLTASEFAFLLGKLGYSRAFAIAAMRELGAGEKELLSLFSSSASGQPGRRPDEGVEVLELRETPGGHPGWQGAGERPEPRKTAPRRAGRRRAKGERPGPLGAAKWRGGGRPAAVRARKRRRVRA